MPNESTALVPAPKYYLALIFSDPKTKPIQPVSCTHFFMGPMRTQDVRNLVRIVTDFFKFYGPINMGEVLFNIEDMCGEKKDIRVLKAYDTKVFTPLRMLRLILDGTGYDQKVKPKYSFNPHVKADKETHISGHFHSYALMVHNEVITSWPIGKV